MIRPARLEDAEAIAALAAALNSEDGEPLGHVTPATVERDFLSDEPAGFAIVAERDGRIVGYATAHPGYAPTMALRGSYMGDLYVLPAMRRQGLARALLRAVAAVTRQRGGAMVWWTAKPGNAAAEAFYAAMGGVPEPLVGWDLRGAAFDAAAAP